MQVCWPSRSRIRHLWYYPWSSYSLFAVFFFFKWMLLCYSLCWHWKKLHSRFRLCKVLKWLSLPSFTYYPFLSLTRHCVSEWFLPQALSILSVCITLKSQSTCWMADPGLKDQFPISLPKSLESPTAYVLGLGSVGTDRMSSARLFFIQRKASSWLFFECPASVCSQCRNSTESYALPTPQKTHICFLPVLLKQQIEFWLKPWQWQLWVAYSVKSNLESDVYCCWERIRLLLQLQMLGHW